MTDTDKKSDESIDLDYEVTSQKPLMLSVRLPTGERYRIRASIMIAGVRAKFVDGQIVFDLDMQWQTKWEKI